MKRLFSILILSAIIICLSACNVNENQNENNAVGNDFQLKGEASAAKPTSNSFLCGFSKEKVFLIEMNYPHGWTYAKGTDYLPGEEKIAPKTYLSTDRYWFMFDSRFEPERAEAYGVYRSFGSMGYNSYDSDGDDSENPSVIYKDISSFEGYNYSVKTPQENGYYIPIKEDKNTVTAVTKVYYSPEMSAEAGYDGEERYNQGILSYNKELGVYVALEFDKDIVSDEKLRLIAESIKILPYDEPLPEGAHGA